jgi:RAT1-interacting protein
MIDVAALFEEEEVADEDEIMTFRYGKADGDFDWYFGWEALSPPIAEFYSLTDRVPILGCGNSKMGPEMLAAEFPLIVNIELSAVVISQLQEGYKTDPSSQWHVMNCAELSFPNKSFELVIDQGTIDAILCGDNGYDIVEATPNEVFRVLAKGGRFVEIAFGTPGQRFPAMRNVRRD